VQASSSADARVTLHFTLHEATGTLFTGNFDADKVTASRLTTLIDPSWVERSAKQPTLVPGASPARADRAIFDTSSESGNNANPGSMLDLGFRMVLFPAMVGGEAGFVAPDFSKPIDSRDVVLDPTKPAEDQFITVDYSAGTVTLSHPPVPGPGCDVAPNGIITSGTGNNPRGELVLFASFVPYSMEEGQRGSSVRVTGHQANQTPCDIPAQADVFSERKTVLKIWGAQTITSGSGRPQARRPGSRARDCK
jgi:hypothetical protein